jgi:SPP1 gp7 family putative phage head morphogenesis protein
VSVAARQPSREVQTLFNRSARVLTERVHACVASAVRHQGAVGDRERALLAKALGQAFTLADLIARRRTLLWARSKGAEFAAEGGTDVLPLVPFQEAIDDITARMPVLASSAAEVAAVYEAHGFTLAGVSDLAIVERVRDAIADALRAGRGQMDAVKVIEDLGDWSRAYAETVYRNNVGLAYSAGIDRQLEDPDVRAVIVALRYTTAGDVDVRPKHRAMDGTIAPPEHPIWNSRTPPCGHGCRCGRDFMSREDVRREGLMGSMGTVQVRIPNPSVSADPGFGGRPAAEIYAR